MDQNSEINLLERIAGGDHIAFTTLFESYHHNLGSYIFNITKSRELAEEITLDVFLKIWMTRELLLEVNNFKAYLFTVSRNAAISCLRKVARDRTKHLGWTQDPSTSIAEDSTEREVYLSLIDEAINELSPQRKKIYLLSRESGLKYEEIANQLGISKFTVRAHIQQAVNSITQYVRNRMDSQLLLICSIIFF